MIFDWEVIQREGDQFEGSTTARAPVFGGWLVKDLHWDDGKGNGQVNLLSHSMVFVPDPEHVWMTDPMAGVL